MAARRSCRVRVPRQARPRSARKSTPAQTRPGQQKFRTQAYPRRLSCRPPHRDRSGPSIPRYGFQCYPTRKRAHVRLVARREKARRTVSVGESKWTLHHWACALSTLSKDMYNGCGWVSRRSLGEYSEFPGRHLLRLAFVLLEPSDGKLSRSVPRGLGAGNRAWLPSRMVTAAVPLPASPRLVPSIAADSAGLGRHQHQHQALRMSYRQGR